MKQRPPMFRQKPHASRWTADEDDILIASYLCTGGIGEAVHRLPHRTRGAVFARMALIRKAEASRAQYNRLQQTPEPAEEPLAPSEFDSPEPQAATHSDPPSGESSARTRSLLPPMDLDRREHIRKRCIWTIQQLGQELALMPVHVARVVQDLARTDFRGPLPLNMTQNDEVLTTQEQTKITRVFKSSKNSFRTL